MTGSATLTGIEKPTPSTLASAIFIELMPTSSPRMLMSAPPELPGLMAASVWIASITEAVLSKHGGTAPTPTPTAVHTLVGTRIAILGVAFKPDSDDVRDSPALDVANRLFTAGADVAVYDPQGNRNAAGRFPRLDYVDSLQEAVTGADLAILLTEWDEFKKMDPAQVAPLMKHRAIIDGRNVLDPQAWIDAGFTHAALGHRFDPSGQTHA